MSLIIDKTKINNCSRVLRELIPQGSIVNSHAFYDGKMEFSLANSNRFVNAHTDCSPVYTFWACLMHDPERLYNMISSESFKFHGEGVFPVLQEVWHKQTSPFIKASLFFLMNRCSSTGMISSGDMDLEKLSATAIAKIKTFTIPENFHLNLSEMELNQRISSSNDTTYHLIPAGDFTYGLFEHGKSVAPEQTTINHRNLVKLCESASSKIVITYNYSQKVLTAYNKSNIILVDKYGKPTTQKDKAQEIIVANF